MMHNNIKMMEDAIVITAIFEITTFILIVFIVRFNNYSQSSLIFNIPTKTNSNSTCEDQNV